MPVVYREWCVYCLVGDCLSCEEDGCECQHTPARPYRRTETISPPEGML